MLKCLEWMSGLRRNWLVLSCSLWWVVGLTVVGWGQLTRSALTGTVTDQTGAAVVGARVVVTNQDTNQVRETTTNDSGSYRVAALDPGIYRVVVEKEGFKRGEYTDIRVISATDTGLNVTLEIGEQADTVTVSAESIVALNRNSPTIGATFEARRVVELPLSAGRDINNLAVLSPNAFRAPGSSGISVNGQRARNNNFTIDGSDNNDISVTIPTVGLAPEAVQEFQIQTNPYNAEFGRNSGGQINVITKSGTNEFHGQAFIYYLGSGLNTLNNLEKQRGLRSQPRFNTNQVGGDFGGRVIRDKTFFYGFFQANLTRTGQLLGPQTRIPTPAGFAALSTVPLRPASGTNPAQTAASRQAILDSIRFLQDVYALNPTFINLSTININGVPIQTGVVQLPITQPADEYNYVVRGDHQFSASNRLTGRYIFTQSKQPNVVSNLQFGSRFAGAQNIRDQNLAVSDTHTFSPTLLNEFRFSYIRRNLQFPENDPTTPTTNIGGAFTIGGLSNFPQGRIQNSFQFQNLLTKQLGNHTLKAGFDIRYIQLDNTAAFNSKGTFTFNNLADFLNNNVFQFQQALQTASFDARQISQFYFFQDDWRVTPSLTLNLGIRYETNDVPFGFFGARDPESRSVGVPGPVRRDNNNVAPRIGFAWNPRVEGDGFIATMLGTDRTVFRGGYGVSYDVLFYNILTVNASNYPRVVVGQQNNILDQYPRLLPVTGRPVFNPLATYVNTPEDAQNPRSEYYSFNFQRQFFRDFVLEVGYTGSRSFNGINQIHTNFATLTPAQIADAQAGRPVPGVQARRLNPNWGARILIATSARASYNAGYIDLRKRFSYGLQFGLAYTFSKLLSDNDESLGVAAIAVPSPQVPQDFTNIRRGERSVSAFDRPHRVVFNFVYEIPWLKSAPKWTEYLFGGWQLSGVVERQSGQPFTILTGVDTNGNGVAGDRPNFNPNGTFTLDPVTRNLRTFSNPRTTGQYFVPVVGATGFPLINTVGNGTAPRNSLRAEPFNNTNLSLLKRIKLLERYSFELRADYFNVFNQDFYGIPVNNMNSPDFGRNLNAWGRRTLTLSGRFRF